MTGKREKRIFNGNWQQEGAKSVLKVKGTQDVRKYINRIQATVFQLVALRPIFKVFPKQETG